MISKNWLLPLRFWFRRHTFAALASSAICLLALAGFCAPLRAAQNTQKQPLGALQATGHVTVNGNAVQGAQTIFSGDALQTGADGAASVDMPEVGTFTIAANTEISFPASKFLASLQHGTVGLHASQGARTVEVQFGNYLVFVPEYETEATAAVTVAADGSARVECQLGSVGVTAIEGSADVFLHPGQAVNVSAAGQLGAVQATAGGPPTPAATPAPTAAPSGPSTGTTPTGNKTKTILILLGVGGGAAAIAGAALAAHSSSSSSSPSPSSLGGP
jgi:hypothetical protein